jgi:Arc/MetJ family transcription regulator
VRTNIDIDDKLMKQAMKATGSTTKRQAVDAALRQTIQLKRQEGIRKLRGKVVWRGPEDDWSASDEQIQNKRQEASS